MCNTEINYYDSMHGGLIEGIRHRKVAEEMNCTVKFSHQKKYPVQLKKGSLLYVIFK